MKVKLLLLIFCFPWVLLSQEWVKNLPADNAQKGELTFQDIQKAFNQYNIENGVVGGKRLINGQKVKVPGWKQFKRWEYFWESRVNPVSGEFPKTSAAEEFAAYLKNSPNAKSSAGAWTAIGPSTSTGGYAGIGRVNCIAFHPTDNNTFWIGTPSGGLWKTTDGGSSWTVLTDNNSVLGVSDIAIPSDYATSNTIYIATGDKDGGSVWSLGGGNSNDNNSMGVLKSTDGGATWNTTGLTYTVSQNKLVGRLLIHPTNTNILLAGTSDGVKKTVDGGTNWTSEYTGTYIIDMEFKPGDPTVLYASNKDYWGVARILKSTNTGDSWTITKNFADTDYRVEIAVTPNDAQYIYAIVANQESGLTGIYKSIDGGTSFTQLINGDDANKAFLYYYSDGSGGNSGQGSYDLSIAVSPTDKNKVIIGGVNSWKTIDGGTNWTICNMWTSYNGYNFSGAPEVHADKHIHAYRTDGTLFEGNDGGIYKSTNNGTSWTDLSNGIVISQIYRLGVSQTDFNMTINGLQDNGSKLADDAIWSDVTGGDGMECIIDFTDKNIQYATYVEGEIYRTTDLWSNSTTISDNISGGNAGAWVTPYIIDPNNHNALYVGYSDVWKTTNKGNSFTKISTMNTSEKIRSMAMAASNSSYLYIADKNTLWRTINGGTNWTDITGTLPVTSNNITYIAVDFANENTVWVTLGGYNTQRVYESTNGGSTWTNISTGLPNLPVMCVVQNKLSIANKQLYVGTDVGVYVKNGTENWQLFSQGLPNVVVTELDIYYNSAVPENSKIRAATFGRGLWQSDLFSVPLVAPVAAFSASSTTIQQGESITFTDSSSQEPISWAWTFPGGTPTSSTMQNPLISYNSAGIFDVTLVATNSAGSDTETKSGFITVNPAIAPIAGFMADKMVIYEGQSVTFTDTSKNAPTAWNWAFSGGNPSTSSIKNPSVTYANVGTYDVSLMVTNAGGTDDTIYVGYISVLPLPDFPAPTNLTATASGTQVTLNWEKPIVDTLVSEGFEGSWPPAGWEVKYSSTLDGTLSVPTLGTWFQCNENSFANGPNPQYIHSGTYSAGIGFSAPEFNWLITPEFDATLASVLSFWVWYYSDAAQSYITKFHVMVKDGSTWASLMDYGISSPNNEYNTLVELSLAAYAGKTVQVAFVYEYNDGYQLMVDDVLINSKLSGYQLFRDDVELVTLTDTSLLSYIDLSLAPNTYNYYAKALYGNQNISSDTSNHVSAMVYGMAQAAFSATPVIGGGPLVVTFSNNSVNADTYLWDFGDTQTSSEINPVHTFTNPGTYTIILTASNPDNSDSEVKNSYVKVTLPEVTAVFTAGPTVGAFPLEVTFNNTSLNATSYAWDFGDTQSSSVKNPVHTYTNPGTYTVKLTSSNADFSDTEEKVNYITVTQAEVTASFTAGPTVGAFPLEVTFNNTSLNATSYAWDFGDTQSSSVKNPVHSYQSPGLYSVTLVASNADFADTIIKSNYIEAIWPMPIAEFEVNPTTGNDPLVVTFTDLSEFAQQWNWTFGDGNTSSLQNPENTYSKGTYTVTLEVTNPAGTNSITKENLIVVDPDNIPQEWNNLIQVFPNPATSKVTVQMANEKLEPVTIELFDLIGKKLVSQTPVASKKMVELINVNQLEKGNYLLKVTIGVQLLVLKVAVE